MNISIFGLGYVGCVSLGCLAKNGHKIIGVDISQTKVDMINRGVPTIIEKDIDIIIKDEFEKGNVRATTDYIEAVKTSDVTIVCVGTPSSQSGHLNLDYIYNSCSQIGEALKEKEGFHTVVIRSTVMPGTNAKVSEIIAESSGRKVNEEFAVISNPEFLREGTAVKDYYNPPLTVIGGESKKGIDTIIEMYKGINAPVEVVGIRVAEFIKYVNNSYHALKIAFANEVGNVSKKLDIDSHEVMRIFGMDEQLNISTKYFKPGFAYGGSCLPKDLKALNTMSHDFYLSTPVLNSIENSNEEQKRVALDLIVTEGKQRIGFMAISFKAGTDDLRYSPSVELIERLLGKGKEVRIFDKNVQLSRLIGSNKSYIDEKLPHISSLMVDDVDELIENSDIIVIPNHLSKENLRSIPEDKIIIDFSRIEQYSSHPNYKGLNW